MRQNFERKNLVGCRRAVSVRYAPPLGPATPDEILFLSKFRLMGVLFYLPGEGPLILGPDCPFRSPSPRTVLDDRCQLAAQQ